LNAEFLHLIDNVEQLLLELDESGACLSDASVFVGDCLEFWDLIGGRRDGLFVLSSTIREDGGGVELPLVTSAVLFSASAFELVEGRGHEW